MQRLPNRDTPIAHGGDAFAEQWHKPELMCEERAAAQLTEYLGECEVRASERAERCTALLRSSSSDARVPRLKRVYEVRARGETMFVLAKSVGWGWLGYPAFIAAEKLADRVPHLLGLRDGILYTQYVPQNGEAQPSVEDIADYVAARARLLRPEAAPSALAPSKVATARSAFWKNRLPAPMAVCSAPRCGRRSGRGCASCLARPRLGLTATCKPPNGSPVPTVS